MISFGVVGVLMPFLQMCICTYFSTGVMDNDINKVDRIHRLKAYGLGIFSRLLPLESLRDLVQTTDKPMHTSKPNATGGMKKYITLYYSRYVSMNCIMLLTLLLTFGLVYPPLACILLINVFISTLAFQLSIHYHSNQMSGSGLDLACHTAWHVCLYNEVSMLHKIIFGSRLVILMFSALFAAFVLYDTVSLESQPVAWCLIGLIVGGTWTAIQISRKYDVLSQYIYRDSGYSNGSGNSNGKGESCTDTITNTCMNTSSDDSAVELQSMNMSTDTDTGVGVGFGDTHTLRARNDVDTDTDIDVCMHVRNPML